MEEDNHPSAASPLSSEPSDPSLQRKHTAMIQRLSNLHQSRTSLKPNSSSSTSATATAQSFLSDFSKSKLSISSQIFLLPNSHSPKSDLDSISLSISDLEQLLASHSYLLPSYELRSCLHSISSLKSSLNSASSTLVPKKKFSFKNKPQSKNPTISISQNHLPSQDNEFVVESNKSFDSPGFKDKTNEVLMKDFRGGEVGEFVLVNLEGCEVRLMGSVRALFVHKLRNCKVYVGPVHGSVLMEEVEDCVFVLASHQIRIHHAKRCDFYLRVRSRPIIEDSNGVRFAPYCLRYDGIDEDLEKANLGEELGNWAKVDDFKWLRAVQSPNWSVLEECDRIGTVSISSLDG